MIRANDNLLKKKSIVSIDTNEERQFFLLEIKSFETT